MKMIRAFGLAAILCVAGASLVSAGTIYIPGTGQDVVGGLDQNFQITADSTGLYTGTLPGQAVVVTSQPGAWASIAGSQWIGPTADQANIGNTNAGSTTYQTMFSVSDPATAVMNLSLLVDNDVTVWLNNTQVFTVGGPLSQLYQLPVTTFSLNSGFVSGVNTLDFVVGNGYGPTGVDVSSAPEPSTLAFSALGLLAVGFFRRRR